jgi:hypothetical protein
MTQHLFPGPHLKVARARKNIEVIETELRGYIAGNHRGMKAHFNPVTGKMELHPIVPDFDIDTTATAVGDVVHNLRSALDLLATKVVQASKGNANGVYFPIAHSEIELTDPAPGATKPVGGMIKAKNFHRASPAAIELLKTFRPWSGPSGNALLITLHNLNLVDKHRDILEVHQLMLAPDIFIGPGGRDIHINNGPLVGLPMKPNLQPVELAFSRDHLGGREVIPVLHEMAGMVEDIVQAFEALFRASDKSPVDGS